MPIPLEGPPPIPAPHIDVAPVSRIDIAPAPPIDIAPVQQIDIAPAPVAAERAIDRAPPLPPGEIPPYGSAAWNPAPAPAETDPRAIVQRLQGAVARVLPAIEATLATLTAAPAHPREMERAARVLAALTRTLSELNGLVRQQNDARGGAFGWQPPRDVEALRRALAAKLEAFVASRQDLEREKERAQGGGGTQ